MANKVLAIAGERGASYTFLYQGSVQSEGVGNLLNEEGLTSFKKAVVAKIKKLGNPDIILHDCHPDLLSTRLAVSLAIEQGINQVCTIRHHHAHIMSVLAEHKLKKGAGLALDGLGLGEDNELWGGELIITYGLEYKRIGRLKPLRLLGGDKATLEPWRIKAAFIFDNLGEEALLKIFPDLSLLYVNALKKHINTPFSSSAGRLFDLAALLANKDSLMQFEQATEGNTKVLENGYIITFNEKLNIYELDLSPLLIQAIKEISSMTNWTSKDFPAIFHGTLAYGLAEMINKALSPKNHFNIALSGGCILNKVLSSSLKNELDKRGFNPLFAQNYPPSDEGVSFGMASIGEFIL